MKGFYIYNLILEVVMLNIADCRITSDEVYSLLSQRLNLENSLLRNELKELKAIVKKQDEKIAALGLSACRTPENAEDAVNNHQDLEERITVMQHAFHSEKELLRGIQSNISDLEIRIKASSLELEPKLQFELATGINSSTCTSKLESTPEEEIVKGIKLCTSELESKLEKEIVKGILSSTSKLESKLKEEIATGIKSSTSELKSKLEKEHVNGLKLSILELESKLGRQKVAFSAQLSTSTSELATGSTIVFDKIIYQDGNSYNSQDGVFTCPQSGVYMFSIVLHCWHGNDDVKTLAATLLVDSEIKSYVVSESQHSQHNDQASNLVILSVKQGQKVWIQTYEKDVKIFRSFSTFSGVLLYS